MKEDQQQDHETRALFGEGLIYWHVDEYPRYQRSKAWYVLMTIVGAVLIVYALATANLLFAVIILMVGVITLISFYKEPDQIDVALTTTGIIIGDAYYEYSSVRDFSVVYDPPHKKLLYVDFDSSWRPLLTVPLGAVDPNDVRENLLPYCVENLERLDETLTDMIRRLYKF